MAKIFLYRVNTSRNVLEAKCAMTSRMQEATDNYFLPRRSKHADGYRYPAKRRYVTKLLQNLGKPQPKESSINKSQKLMLYNEIVEHSHSGCYFVLPLGLRALEKLTKIIDEEMQMIGGEKIAVPTLSPCELWKKSGRWQSTGPELFKLEDRHGQMYCLGPTHEESVTKFLASLSLSYKRLPIRVYQISRKFRDEIKPKNALLRGREFEMKDMYTFDIDENSATETYHTVCHAYSQIFNRLNLPYIKVEGDTGNIGGQLSHEYHFQSTVGEDTLLTCNKCSFKSNKELVGDKERSSFCSLSEKECELKESAGIEIGHTFLLGTKYSSVFNSTYFDKDGKTRLTQMGCYGIGISRLLQASIEVLSTDKQIKWPQLIAPYQICIIPQMSGFKSEEFFKLAEDMSDDLNTLHYLNREIVIDDRIHMTIGKRLYEAKRIGYPHIIIIGEKALENPAIFEIIDTFLDKEPEFLTLEELRDKLSTIITI
ncbi:probable proline--tRNA ligase, mitochondrial isoform X1 [Patella vulgata]|uniref:probable proline--tRNA ligase, mitochondrial isoform X1 n=2 Tax=Patella vulgata TaxID=6465 RepID=UPI00217F5BEA|nr:probable proline--tRNA ligase, mitochondrial isoform X1 [Patella vulgata]